MKYRLDVGDREVAAYLYTFLEVFWLSGSLASLEFIKEFFGISPLNIKIDKKDYFLIKMDQKNKFGYYIESGSLEDLIHDSINEEIRLGALYLNKKFRDDDGFIEVLLQTVLLTTLDGFTRNPSIYKVVPMPVNINILCVE